MSDTTTSAPNISPPSVDATAPLVPLTRKDFQTSNDVRWCPGCGDYAILATMQRFLPELGVRKENMVFVSGIGCAARFPYYMETYGMHTVHGRAPTIATGLKVARPELDVWVITGDGDSLAIGGNHTLHALRRNVQIKILLFNNRIYGLTKGQYSPSSEQGKITKSTPTGSLDHPVNPIQFALGASGTFIARTVDTDAKHMMSILKKAHAHQGATYVEILQNCVVFNDGQWKHATDKASKAQNVVVLEDGKPLLFDAGKQGVSFNRDTLQPVIIDLEKEPERISEIIVHDEKDPTGLMGFVYANMNTPDFPTPIGVFRRVEREAYDAQVHAQGGHALEKKGRGNLRDLIYAGDMWTVE